MKKIFIISAILFLYSINNIFGQVPTNGLIANYPFNGNANDISGNNLNGTVNGATLTTDRNGNANSAYSFNGSSNYISVANNALLNFATNNKISVGLWIYPTSYAASSYHKIFLSKQTGSGASQQGFDCGFTSSNIYLQTRNGSGDNMGGAGYGYSIPLNQWSYLVMVKDVQNVSFYYNGNLVASYINSPSSTIGDNSSDLYIGKATWSNVNAESFAGKIDEVLIYNRALTETEVTALYNGCVQPTQASTPQGTTKLCINPGSTNYTTSGATNATSYTWIITPSNAGTITGTTTNATVQWNNTYTGTASITTKGVNGTGCEGSFSNPLLVTINSLPTVSLSSLNSLCSNSNQIQLTGGLPTGGSYLGTGVSNGYFNPTISGVGTFQITYAYTDQNTTCSNTETKNITVNPLPTVSFNTLPTTISKLGNQITLVGSPSGGTFNGSGVSANNFNPANANLGKININYSYTNSNNCSNSSSQNIIVYDTLGVVCSSYIYETDTLIINVQTTSLNSVNWSTLKIYPNPATDVVFVNTSNYLTINNYTVKIENALGQTIYSNLINQQIMQINTSQFGGRGTYFVKILDNNNNLITTRKIIIQ
jgi:hypothetical protein